MLEVLNTQPERPILVFTGGPPLAKINNSEFGRSLSTASLYNRSIIFSGGVAAPANPYPVNFRVFTLTANSLDLLSSTMISQYDGSSPGCAQQDSLLWIAQGHDGSYQRYLKKRNASTGALISTTSNSPGPGQTFAKVAVIDSDNLLWGMGLSPNRERGLYKYRISTNSWSLLATLPAEYGDIDAYFQAQKLDDGRILVSYSLTFNALIFYNPSTNQFSMSQSVDKVVKNKQFAGLNRSATAVIGKYLLLISQGYTDATSKILSCVRYDTIDDSFSVIDFPDQPASWLSMAVVDKAQQYLYLLGGNTTYPLDLSTASAIKHQRMLIYPFSQFLV